MRMGRFTSFDINSSEIQVNKLRCKRAKSRRTGISEHLKCVKSVHYEQNYCGMWERDGKQRRHNNHN